MRRILIVLGTFFWLNTHAQVYGDIKNVISLPPSPTSASLGEYGASSKTLFTGTPDISIPLFIVQEQELNLPVNLNYNAKGVRVSDQGSWAGLSWNLSCGGTISRSLHGKPDETPDGFLETKGFLGMKHGENLWNPPQLDEVDYCGLLKNSTNHSHPNGDLQADQFFFSIGRYSGYFVFGHGMEQVITIPYQNLKITPSLNSNEIEGFEVITPEGLVYCFGNYEIEDNAIEISTSWSRSSSGDSDDRIYNSSWHLTRIKNHSGEDIVVFSYEEDEEYTEFLSHSAYNGPLNVSSGCLPEGGSNAQNLSTSYHYIEVSSKKLNTIITEKSIVQFETSNRTDVLGKKLDFIKLYNSADNPLTDQAIRTFEFNYGVIPENNRMFLTSVSEVSAIEGTKGYSFEYNNPELLPYIESCEQDLWGYFNDNDATTLVPDIGLISWNTTIENLLADRSTNPATVGYGMLEKITYPTGGYSEYTFESNKVEDPNTIFLSPEYNTGHVGGVRIYKIKNVTDNNTDSIIYEYHMPYDTTISSGTLFSTFDFYYEYNSLLSEGCDGFFKGLQSSSVQNLSSFTGTHYGYQYITVLNGENGKNGKTIYEYDTNNFGNAIVGIQIEGKLKNKTLYSYDTGAFSKEYELCNTYDTYLPRDYQVNSFHVTPLRHGSTICGSSNPTIRPAFDVDFYYIQSQWRYISSSVENFYSSPNTISIEKTFEYNFENQKPSIITTNKSDGKTSIDYFTYPIDYLSSAKSDYENCVDNRDALLFAACDEYFAWEINHASFPDYEYDWETGDYMESFTQAYSTYTCESDYENALSLLLPVADDRSEAIISMAKKNIISPLIEELNTVDGRVIGGRLSEFKVTNDTEDFLDWKIRVSNLKSLSIQSNSSWQFDQFSSSYLDITESQGRVPSNVLFSSHPSYETEVCIQKFNEKGNPIEYSERDGIVSSNIWGYNNSYPIASFNNSTNSDVAYSGYEDWSSAGTDGNWWVLTGPSWYKETDSFTGKSSLALAGTGGIIRTDFTVQPGTYILQVCGKEIDPGSVSTVHSSINWYNGATLYFDEEWDMARREITITTPQVLELTLSNVKLDDLALYPIDAEMTTYTFDPLVGMTSQTDPNGKTTYYEYDTFGRLIQIKDSDGNLIQETNYNYANQ